MGRRFYYGWVIVGVAWLALFAATSSAPPVFTLFIKPMGEELGWSRTLMSGAVSLGTLAAVPVVPLVGRWLDRYGSRLVVAVAGILAGGALASLAWVQGVWGFYIGFGLSRMVDQGVVSIAITTAVSNWFIRKRGRTLGIIMVGRAAGATFLPLIAFFIMRTWGWRMSWLVIGITVWLILVIPAALFLRRRPEDMGLRPDGLPPEDTPPSGQALHQAHTRPPSAEPEPAWTLREALGTPALWLIMGAIFIRGVAAPGVAIHLMPFLLDRGLAPAVSVIVVSLSAAAIGAGGMAGGLLAERGRVAYLMAATMAAQGAAIVVLLLTHDALLALIYAVVSGVALGGVFTLEVVIWADYYGRMSLGTIQGFTMPFVYVGTALGPIVAGLSYDVAGSYQIAFLVFTLGYLLAAVMLVAAKPPRKHVPSR